MLVKLNNSTSRGHFQSLVDVGSLARSNYFFKNGNQRNLNNKLINGDSINELKNIPDETFDLIFADPPYNLQLQKFNKT